MNGHHFHWQHLAQFFQPIALRLLVPWFAIVPIILVFTRDVPESVVLTSNPYIALTFDLPFRWWLLYWASLLYSSSFVVYRVFSPAFIRQYPNFAAYVSQNHSPRWIARMLSDALKAASIDDQRRLVSRLLTKGLVRKLPENELAQSDGLSVEAEATVLRFTCLTARYKFDAIQGRNEGRELERETFWEIYEPFARSRPLFRLLAWLLLSVALGFFGWAVFESVRTVVRALVHVN